MNRTIVQQSPGESEKLTMNLGVVDLGQIDLLVQEGFYANRSDFLRTAVRSQLTFHAETLKQTTTRRVLCLGIQVFDRSDLEASLREGVRIQIRVVGLVRIAADVSADLADDAIESIEVLGTLQASDEVKEVLARKLPPRSRRAR